MKPQNSLIHSVPVFLSVFVSYLLHFPYLVITFRIFTVFSFLSILSFYYLTFTVCMYIYVHVCLSCVYMVITIKLESLKERLHWEGLWRRALSQRMEAITLGRVLTMRFDITPIVYQEMLLFQMGANKGRRNWMWEAKQGEVKNWTLDQGTVCPKYSPSLEGLAVFASFESGLNSGMWERKS